MTCNVHGRGREDESRGRCRLASCAPAVEERTSAHCAAPQLPVAECRWQQSPHPLTEQKQQIMDILSQMGGLQSMAKELGINEAQVASGASALAPTILGGIKMQAQSGAGLEGLGGMLSQLGGGGLLDAVLSPEPTDVSQGNAVLGQSFGSKDVSRTVAQSAATQSGLDVGMLKKMLPMLAMLVAGYMAKRGGAAPAEGGSGGGRASMIDMNGDGNALDDIMRMAGKVIR